jgi:transposase
MLLTGPARRPIGKEGCHMDEEFRVYVGIDWATEAHQVCELTPSGTVISERVVAHEAESLQALATALIERAGGAPGAVAVAIEVPHGAVVETLLERGLVVFAINPKQLDRFRDRFTVAGAKDDRRDARVLADAVRTDRRAFTRVQLPAAHVLELREETRLHEELRSQWSQVTNRVRQQLARFYPQLLQLGDVDEPWLWALYELVPTPAAAAAVRRARVTRLLHAHRIRRHTTDSVLAKLRAPALTVAPGTVEAAQRHLDVLLAQVRLLHRQRQECERRVSTLLRRPEFAVTPSPDGPPREHSDREILLSLPGVGNLVAATMLAEAGEALATRDYTTLRTRTGVAPITRRSGKLLTVLCRYACNEYLRNACHYWAQSASCWDPRSQQHYAGLRAKGHSHGRALRGVADRLQAVLIAMLRDGTLYDAARRSVQGDQYAAA